MTNNLVWTLLALAMAVASAFLPLSSADSTPGPLRARGAGVWGGSALAALSVLLFAVATFVWPKTFGGDGSWTALALAMGVLVGMFGGATELPRAGFAVGLAVAAASALHFWPESGLDVASAALVGGAFIGVVATAGFGSLVSGGWLVPLAALAVVAVDFLARAAEISVQSISPGVALGLALMFGALVSGVFARSISRFMTGAVGIGALALAGFLVCWRSFDRVDLATLWIAGVLVAVVVHFILTDEESGDSFRFILSTVIWLSVATVAFGIALGYGMSVTVLAGVGALVLLGNSRALMTISTAAVLVLYRLFREMYPEDAKAPDIGQHYTMIGIALGALLPLMPAAWIRDRALRGASQFAVNLLWLVVLLGVPVAAAVLLGAKGAIGLVVGFAFAVVVDGLRGSSGLGIAGIAVGMGALVLTTYGWLGEWVDLERSAKIRAVIAIAVAAALIGGALFGIGRKSAVESDGI